jgi:hypothetical protein
MDHGLWAIDYLSLVKPLMAMDYGLWTIDYKFLTKITPVNLYFFIRLLFADYRHKFLEG